MRIILRNLILLCSLSLSSCSCWEQEKNSSWMLVHNRQILTAGEEILFREVPLGTYISYRGNIFQRVPAYWKDGDVVNVIHIGSGQFGTFGLNEPVWQTFIAPEENYRFGNVSNSQPRSWWEKFLWTKQRMLLLEQEI